MCDTIRVRRSNSEPHAATMPVADDIRARDPCAVEHAVHPACKGCKTHVERIERFAIRIDDQHMLAGIAKFRRQSVHSAGATDNAGDQHVTGTCFSRSVTRRYGLRMHGTRCEQHEGNRRRCSPLHDQLTGFDGRRARIVYTSPRFANCAMCSPARKASA